MTTHLMLAIKPSFANDILEGKKKYEFRRLLFRRKGIQHALIYSSMPEQKVIGEFRVVEVLSLDPQTLWHCTKAYAGIAKTDFDRYFAGKSEAHAIKIGSPVRYSKPLDLLRDFGLKRPPQSFCYVCR